MCRIFFISSGGVLNLQRIRRTVLQIDDQVRARHFLIPLWLIQPVIIVPLLNDIDRSANPPSLAFYRRKVSGFAGPPPTHP
jgi:hypothetical protein